MKVFNIRFSLAISILFIFSCNVLEHDPQDAIVPDQAFNSEASVRSAVVGLSVSYTHLTLPTILLV